MSSARNFGTIPVTIWQDKRIKKRGPNCLLTALHVYSCGHSNCIHLCHLPLEYIAADTGIDIAEVAAHLDFLCEIDICLYDSDADLLWCRQRMIDDLGDPNKNQTKDGDKRLRSIPRILKGLPTDASLVKQFVEEYGTKYIRLSKEYTRRQNEAKGRTAHHSKGHRRGFKGASKQGEGEGEGKPCAIANDFAEKGAESSRI